MADSLDPHGTRGSTDRHALDYKGEVKSFSSADILASFAAAKRGDVVAVPSQPSNNQPPGDTAVEASNGKGYSNDQKYSLPRDEAAPSKVRIAEGASDSAGPVKVRSWIGKPHREQVKSWTNETHHEQESSTFSLEGLKDALRPMERSGGITMEPAAGAPAAVGNLLDLDLDEVTPAAAGVAAYAPTLSDEWASLAAKPPPGVALIGSTVAPPTVAPSTFPQFSIPPNTKTPHTMPPPAMPPPAMPPPNYAQPSMPSFGIALTSIATPSMRPPVPFPGGEGGAPLAHQIMSLNMPPPNMPPPNMLPPSMPPPNMPPPNLPPPSMPPPTQPTPVHQMAPSNMPPLSMPPPTGPPPDGQPGLW